MGYEPVVASLLAIRPIPQAAPALADITALAFTSANGVIAFADLSDSRDRPVFTVGAATAGAARAAGFQNVTSADGAVADLGRLIDAAAPERVTLWPCALEPTGNLARLARRVPVRALAVYEAVETGAGPPDGVDAVLVQSPRAARALAGLWPDLPVRPLVVAQSSAVAEPLRPLTAPRIADRPTEDALLQALGNPPPAV